VVNALSTPFLVLDHVS